MKIAWATKGPPRVMLVSGTDDFLRGRWVRQVITDAHRHGYDVVQAADEGDVVSTVTMAGTFGTKTLVVAPADKISVETVEEHVGSGPDNVSILLEIPGLKDDKKYPAICPVHEGYRINFDVPASKKDLESRAVQFVRVEAARVLGAKDSKMDARLATSVVRGVGTDLGVLAHEVLKYAGHAKARGASAIEVEDVRAMIRGSAEADIQPVRDALSRADAKGMAKALDRVRSKSVGGDPTMLLLRARGGPADLALQWLRVALLLDKGAGASQIASQVGVPEWAVQRDIVPTVRRWGKTNLTNLVQNLAAADRAALRGAPSPWIAVEAALLDGCRAVSV